MSRPFVIAAAKSKPSRTAEASDIAARYLVYKVYDATNGEHGAWQVLGKIGELPETVARAVERGWVVVEQHDSGKGKVKSAALTDEGRRVARKGR
jgi:hypothetical protein